MKLRRRSMAPPTASPWTMSPARSECSTRSWTSVSIRCEPRSPSTAMSSAGRSPGASTPARTASSMSWLMYAMRSTRRTILPSSVAGSPAPLEWRRMPSRTGSVRLRSSSTSTTRSECSLWRNPVPKRSRRQASSTASPMCPNGGWPRSCPTPMASVRSSLRRSARATVRETCVTSSVWVSRVRKWSPSGATNTCVLCFSRRKALLWTIRSRSRWKGVRRRQSASSRARRAG